MAEQRDRKIVELVIDASGVEAGERRAALAYDHLGERAAAAQEKATAAIQQSMRIYENQLPQSIERTAAAYDKLRAKTDPVLAAQLKLETEMTRSLQVINRAVLQGVTTQQQAEQQVLRLRNQQIQQLDEVRRAHERVNDAQTRTVANDNNAQFRRQNLGYQLLDVGQSAAGGINPAMILAQQGPQILQLYAGQGGISAAFRDLATIFAGVARAAGPVIVAGTAVYGVYKLISANTAEARLAIDATTAALAAQAAPLGTVYSQLTELQKLQSDYAKALNESARTQDVASAAIVAATKTEYDAKRSLLELELKRQEAARAAQQSELEITALRLRGAVAEQVTTNMDLERQGFSDPRIGRFVQVPDEVTGLEKTRDILTNNPLSDKVKELTANLSLTDIALQKLREGLGLVGPTAAGQVGQINDLRKALEELRKIGAPALSAADEAARRAMGAVPVVNGILDEEARRRVLAAQRAAQQRLADQDPTITNGDGVRVGVPLPSARPNIELEGLPGSAKTLDSYAELIRKGQERISQLEAETETIGRSGAAVDALRFKMDLLSDAAKNGNDVLPAQRQEIEKLAAAYEKAAEAAGRAKLMNDLQFDRQQLFRSSADQQIASQQRSAGLPVDLTSQEAQMMRDNMRIQELRDGVRGFFTDFRDGLMKGDSIGEALGNAILNALTNALTKTTDRLIDQFVNAILGTGSGGGILGKIGIGGIAANDNFSANTTLGKLLGAANDNAGKAPVTPVTRAPLTDVASYIAQAATQRGIDPNVALTVARSEGGLSSWNLQSNYVKNGVREPSFGPFQLYKGGGLGNAFMSRTGLDPALAQNGPAGIDFALDHASKNGWGAWYGAGKAGISKWQGIGANQNMDGAADAVSKLSSSAGVATRGLDGLGGGLNTLGPAVNSTAQGLGNLGSGLGQFSQQLMAAANGANSPSSMLGGLGSLFGGVSPTSAMWAPNTTFGSFLVRGFAEGTNSAPGGVAMVGERGRELVNLPRGAQVIPNHRTEAMLSGSRIPANVNVSFNVVNNNGSNVKTQRRDTSDGPQFDVIIDEAVAAKLNTPGSSTRRAAKSQFGLSEGLARR